MPIRRRPRNIYKPGALRVCVIVNPPSEGVYYPVESSGHGKRLIDALADSQLLDKEIHSNVFCLEVLDDDGDWCDWYDEDGNGINDEEVKVTERDDSK